MTQVVSANDREIQCTDCPTVFTFTEKEQEFYREKQLNEPKRCKDCRARRKQEWAAKQNNA